jgi:uncharacterized membrane protein
VAQAKKRPPVKIRTRRQARRKGEAMLRIQYRIIILIVWEMENLINVPDAIFLCHISLYPLFVVNLYNTRLQPHRTSIAALLADVHLGDGGHHPEQPELRAAPGALELGGDCAQREVIPSPGFCFSHKTSPAIHIICMQLFKPRQEAFNMPHEERWPGIGIAIMFMFIGIAIFIGLIFSIVNGSFDMSFRTGSIWQLVGLFFLIWFISWIFFRPWRYSHRHWRWEREDAIEILKRRYAKGEITEAQFRKMMAELRKHEHG